MLIIIEGNIGAGKSTLTHHLGNELGAKVFFEPVETNPYLADFYKDPKRYALEMQYWLMASRFEMHEKAMEHSRSSGQIVIMDRSLYGDSVFAKKNWQDGMIDDRGYEAYLQHRKLYISQLHTPEISLYLDVAPEICHDRILNLRKRDCEGGIPLPYLQGLDKCYQELLLELEERGSHVYRVPWNQFGGTKDILRIVETNPKFIQRKLSLDQYQPTVSH